MSESPPARSPSTSRRVITGAALVILVVAAAVGASMFLASSRSTDARSAAEARIRDTDNFVSGETAGDALARSAGDVLTMAEQCERDGGPPDRCTTYYAASAWLQVAAMNALTCTAPGRHDARRAALEVFDLVATAEHAPASADAPDLPPQPCRSRR